MRLSDPFVLLRLFWRHYSDRHTGAIKSVSDLGYWGGWRGNEHTHVCTCAHARSRQYNSVCARACVKVGQKLWQAKREKEDWEEQSNNYRTLYPRGTYFAMQILSGHILSLSFFLSFFLSLSLFFFFISPPPPSFFLIFFYFIFI